MVDTTINDSSGNADDESVEGVEIPVRLETLNVAGTTPEVGDSVEVKVKGTVERVVNGYAYVSPDTVNDEPMGQGPIKPNPMKDEGDRLRDLSQQGGDIGNDSGSY